VTGILVPLRGRSTMCGSGRPRASSKCCRRGQILAECTLGGGAESSGRWLGGMTDWSPTSAAGRP